MQFVRLNQLLLHYAWVNNARDRTFVFINALGTDFRIWDAVADRLKPHANVLRFDKRGHGLSDVSDHTQGLSGFSADAVALLNYLDIQTCIPVGLSVGGMIAQQLAHLIPEKITQLVLCDTRHVIGNATSWNDRIAAVTEKGIPAISDGVMQRWFSETYRKENANAVAGYRNMLERCNAKGYVQTCAAIRDADTTAIARRITVPTLCIAGSEDKSTTPEEVKQLRDLIAGARYAEIAGSGHLPCVDNPEALSRLIEEFVNQHI